MAAKNLTLKLTRDQQKQITETTGKKISEINIDLTSSGRLSELDLDQVVGGKKKFVGGTNLPPPK